MKPLKGFQEIAEHKKRKSKTKIGQNYLKNSSPGQNAKRENNFTHLDYQDNTLQRSLQTFQTNYCISLRNNGI